jgi:hypothetical protein
MVSLFHPPTSPQIRDLIKSQMKCPMSWGDCPAVALHFSLLPPAMTQTLAYS